MAKTKRGPRMKGLVINYVWHDRGRSSVTLESVIRDLETLREEFPPFGLVGEPTKKFLSSYRTKSLG